MTAQPGRTKDWEGQAEFGQTLFANISPSLFKDRREEGDKGHQNLRESRVIAKYQAAAGLKVK